MKLSDEELQELLNSNPDLTSANKGIIPFKSSARPLKLALRAPKKKPTIREKDFQEQFRKLATTLGYLFYHTHRSQFSPSGFPDNVLVRLEPEPRLIIAELKTDDLSASQPSFDQWMWLYILQHVGKPVEAYLFRPSDWETIIAILQ